MPCGQPDIPSEAEYPTGRHRYQIRLDAAVASCRTSAVSGHYRTIDIAADIDAFSVAFADAVTTTIGDAKGFRLNSSIKWKHNPTDTEESLVYCPGPVTTSNRPQDITRSIPRMWSLPLRRQQVSIHLFTFEIPIISHMSAKDIIRHDYLHPDTGLPFHSPIRRSLQATDTLPNCSLVVHTLESASAAETFLREFIGPDLTEGPPNINVSRPEHHPELNSDRESVLAPRSNQSHGTFATIASSHADSSRNKRSIGTYANIIPGSRRLGQYCFNPERGTIIWVRNELLIGLLLTSEARDVGYDEAWPLAAAIDDILAERSKPLVYKHETGTTST
ncbi:hypothetical protein Dda_5340 [Drechslerella dactyloides]|uniref:Uncharacterized protein n=1 Tax=Drechslerella dactyloides TaxID=74499 RepID=A0AAD6NIS2_DREDA|nr:hypothetical protein Dda_5340 [Drechslerella dactyloides]